MDELRDQICKALGVTWEEVEAFDIAKGGPERRAARKHFEEVEMPARIQASLDSLNALLPDGLQLVWANEAPDGG